MFKRISAFFNNLKIGRKLAVGFGGLVFLTLLTGAGSLYTAQLVSAAKEDALWAEKEVSLAQQIEIELLQARRREKDFLLRNTTEGFQTAYDTYVVANQQHTQAILDLVEQSRQGIIGTTESDLQQDLANLDAIQQAVLAYQTGFADVVKGIEERGFEDTGLEGAFRTAARALEASPALADLTLQVTYLEMRRHEKDYLLRGQQEYVDATRESNAQLKSQIRGLDISSAEKSQALSLADDYLTNFEALVAKDAENQATTDAFRAQAQSVEPQVEMTVSRAVTAEAAALAAFNAAESQGRFLDIALVALSVAIGVGLALVISRGITRQVDEITKVFHAAAVGDFDTRAKVFNQDEIGQTADGVNAMLTQLTNLLSRVEEAAQSEIEQIFNTAADGMRLIDRDFNVLRVNTTLCEMAGVEPGEALREKCYETFRGPVCHTASCTLNRIINGEKIVELEVDKQRKDGTAIPCTMVATPFYGQDGQLAGIVEDFRDITERKQAEQQLQAQNEALANALDELRKLIANVEVAAGQVTDASSSMAEVVQLIAGQATTSAQIAEQATSSAQEGDRAVNDTVAAMGRIRESAQETTRRIKRLGEASQEISEVVRLIDDIADRVTVLALNASIQAAAAGEAGRGFAVVAEEVQRLAERATSATRQIENMIKTIQGEINEAMIGVEESTHEVVDGSQLAQGAGERISDLNRVIGDLSGLIQHVAQTTTQQTSQSLATLANLASDLQASVTALRIPDASHAGGNGDGALVSTLESEG